MNMKNILTEQCKNRAFVPSDSSYGSRNYDPGVLHPEQKEKFNQYKIVLRLENEAYMHNHPEIRGLVSIMLRHFLEKKPSRGEEVQELCAAYFGRPRGTIAAELLDYLLEIKQQGAIVAELRREVASTATEAVEKPLDPEYRQ
ncbi:uncharacterized protein LOC116417032 [Nasonia vitripennis]|uniref:Uncharacterized protein n=1 Tax=Nasonia vitripennis TaxID=7425 RepID=A0A7M7QQ86_NASVI|nr:uncharacterized protein LOC116417032 [Nasonia vitripennis]XP_032452108.1 uncharacterized protein LOC116417032 [Nasonia vitripennis]